jgi:hypothetical protein
MAFLYVLEFDSLGRDAAGQYMQLAKLKPIAQTRTDFNSSTAGPTFNSSTKFIRLVSPSNCIIEWGGGDATAGSAHYLPGGVVEYVEIGGATTFAVWDGST